MLPSSEPSSSENSKLVSFLDVGSNDEIANGDPRNMRLLEFDAAYMALRLIYMAL